MSVEERCVIDGVEVDFLASSSGGWRVVVVAGERGAIGRLELAAGSSDFYAYELDGRALETPSRWGGAVRRRFGTRELAARALLEASRSGGRGAHR